MEVEGKKRHTAVMSEALLKAQKRFRSLQGVALRVPSDEDALAAWPPAKRWTVQKKLFLEKHREAHQCTKCRAGFKTEEELSMHQTSRRGMAACAKAVEAALEAGTGAGGGGGAGGGAGAPADADADEGAGGGAGGGAGTGTAAGAGTGADKGKGKGKGKVKPAPVPPVTGEGAEAGEEEEAGEGAGGAEPPAATEKGEAGKKEKVSGSKRRRDGSAVSSTGS